ncbi:RNA 2',3'-cyclic phosphodiesterase [Bacillus taeanensis]|nr:RNA 2',3'-cyclic phosphodiesterase [Bacillus taeanensis]
MKKLNPHFFLAVPISGEIRQYLHDWTQEVQNHYPFKQWVHLEDYHITLSFLGKASLEQIEGIKKEVEKTAANHQSFSLTIDELNIFGREQSPRIFWVGVVESKPLRSLQKDVKNVCEREGFLLEKRPYKPHITLAKKWVADKVFPYADVKKRIAKNDELTWDVKEIVLYETHLDRIPKYEAVKSFTLKD